METTTDLAGDHEGEERAESLPVVCSKVVERITAKTKKKPSKTCFSRYLVRTDLRRNKK